MSFETDKANVLNALESGQRTAVEVELSPEMVGWLLEKNSAFNRRPSKTRVLALANSIAGKGYIPVDDLKMHEGHIVNGQHRLMALESIYKSESDTDCRATELFNRHHGFPKARIIVNIPKDEAVLIDTCQPRSMDQRIYMATGEQFHPKFRAAVYWELSYGLSGSKCITVTDEEVIERMRHRDWVEFVEDLSPKKQISICNKTFSFSRGQYCALKQFHTRAVCVYDDIRKKSMWEIFIDELWGTPQSRMIQLFRDYIMIGAKKYGGGSAEVERYRKTISYLHGFLNDMQRIHIRSFWPSMAESELPPKRLWTKEMEKINQEYNI